MPDVTTAQLKLLQLDEGLHSNEWGDLTNLNLKRIEISARGYTKIPVIGPMSLTANPILVDTDTAAENAYFNWIELTGTPGATTAVTVHAPVSGNDMVWNIYNNTDSIINFTPSGGTLIALAASRAYILAYNSTGTAFIDITAALQIGKATTIDVQNEATDTTCFPLFATAATGDLGGKTNSGLTFNSASGLLAVSGGIDKIATATGAVSVVGAAAPTVGQILTATSGTVATWQTLPADNAFINSRNTVLNQDPVSQGQSTRTGFSATIYTGTGASNPIATGVDMSTGNFGGLVWIKQRSLAIESHRLFDTVRGVSQQLFSNLINVELTNAQTLTAFSSTGFTVGTDPTVNEIADTYVAWSWQTTKKVTGATNRNKAYTAHYNPDMGFSIVGYTGDGADGHEIPHHLGVVPELSIFKNRNTPASWLVFSTLFPAEFLSLNTTAALAALSIPQFASSTTFKLDGGLSSNESNSPLISYHFASVPGVSKIGKYIGTGATGNYVECGFKPAFVLVKNLTSANSWVIDDSIRGNKTLFPAATNAESAIIDTSFDTNGFLVITTSADYNTLNDEYLFMAFAETAIDSTKVTSDYSYPTTADTLSIQQNSLLSFANGFNSSGQVDTQENVGAGITKVLGAGFESQHLWLYKNKAGSYLTTENRPLEGITRNGADKWGVVSPSDITLRTTAKHFDYGSSTGVALASGEDSSTVAYTLFSKHNNDVIPNTSWLISTVTTSWVQYKQTEKRILKSWRLRESDTITFTPNRFTIEGSNDGFAWTEIDTTYKAATGVDYNTVSLGASLWGPLQSTSSNTTAYLYHRINITSNNGHLSSTGMAELEFNTILPSDYYLVKEGKIYEYLGPELVTQLTTYANQAAFDVDWTRGANVTFDDVNDEIDFAVSSGVTTQTGAIATIGKRYEVLFDIANFSAGTLSTSFGGTLVKAALVTNGTYAAIVVPISTAGFVCTPDAAFVGSVKVISAKLLGNTIERLYLAELQTDSVGDVTWFKNLPVAKQRFSDVEVHNDLKVHGEITNRGIATAWVNFDGTKNPPLIHASFNVSDVVDLGVGIYKIILNNLTSRGSPIITVENDTTGTSSLRAAMNPGEFNSVFVAYREAGVLADHIFSMAIFGGKEIL